MPTDGARTNASMRASIVWKMQRPNSRQTQFQLLYSSCLALRHTCLNHELNAQQISLFKWVRPKASTGTHFSFCDSSLCHKCNIFTNKRNTIREHFNGEKSHIIYKSFKSSFYILVLLKF